MSLVVVVLSGASTRGPGAGSVEAGLVEVLVWQVLCGSSSSVVSDSGDRICGRRYFFEQL